MLLLFIYDVIFLAIFHIYMVFHLYDKILLLFLFFSLFFVYKPVFRQLMSTNIFFLKLSEKFSLFIGTNAAPGDKRFMAGSATLDNRLLIGVGTMGD